MDVSKANELFETAIRLAADAQTLRDALQVEFLSGQLAEVVATDYDLGDVLRVEQIFGGFENLSFAVVTRDGDGERAVLRAQVQVRHGRARDPLRARARRPHPQERLRASRARVRDQARRHAGDARRAPRRRARHALLRRVRDARRRGQVHLDREPLHGHGVRGRRPHPGALPSGRLRLRARRAVPRAAAHHGVPRDHARHVQRLRGRDEGHQVRPLLPRQAAGDPRGDRPGPHARSRARGAAALPHVQRLPPRQPQVARRARASACSTSTGPSSTTASSTSPSASSTSAPRGRTRTTASCAWTRPRSS